MSLDVYLTIENAPTPRADELIPIRENGSVKLISREEWDDRFPGREPVTIQDRMIDDEVYWANITHNLNRMASEAGLYLPLWRPEELGVEVAAQLIVPIEHGLAVLQSDPERFKEFNPSNGWGDYEGLVRFTEKYLKACKEYPNATVRVSR